ncbi:MAG TPA: enoyl-CoA hydratase [Desulfomonilaceae bacterium]|nr:enoyl-CoA hydratase [Desulfomonilaceae bacterium]
MEYTNILVEIQGAIGVITLNSPKTINALSKNMIGEIIAALEGFAADKSVRVLIIKANGKHFCSGHNLSEMVDGDKSEYRFIFEQCSRMMQLVHKVPQTVIAQVHGVATAAGCQLVATCDLAVADETARFATPGVRIGLFCTTPMVALSRAVGRKLALEMLLTGRMVPADEAERHGLVNKVVPEAELEKTTMDLALSIAEASPLVLAIGKKAFYNQIELDETRAYEYGNDVITLNLMTDDAQNGIKAFLEKRKPTWVGR